MKTKSVIQQLEKRIKELKDTRHDGLAGREIQGLEEAIDLLAAASKRFDGEVDKYEIKPNKLIRSYIVKRIFKEIIGDGDIRE